MVAEGQDPESAQQMIVEEHAGKTGWMANRCEQMQIVYKKKDTYKIDGKKLTWNWSKLICSATCMSMKVTCHEESCLGAL